MYPPPPPKKLCQQCQEKRHTFRLIFFVCCVLLYFIFFHNHLSFYIPSSTSLYPPSPHNHLTIVHVHEFSLSPPFLLNPSTHFFIILHHLGFGLTARGIILICARQLGQQHMKIQKYYII